MTTKKQSLLIGALSGTFGIFVSKLLGLFYVVPLNSLAGEGNMAFYSIAYTYYDLLLKICGAGIPFAIAALVAKYYSREDYKTVLLIKKLGSSLLLVSSFIIALIFILSSNTLASSILGDSARIEDINSLRNLFYILSLALLVVPFLSSLRGYYQGLKLMKEYGASQVIEQFVRVFGIIFLGYLFVQILNFDSIYAIYMAMLSAAIGAVVTVIYLIFSTKSTDREVMALAKNSTRGTKDALDIFKELLSLGIPYLIISFLGTTSALINSNFFVGYATSIGTDFDEAMLALGILQTNCNKIAAIPQVMTLGFSAGLVPYLTEALEKHDLKTLKAYINQILETVLFLLVPIVSWFIIYARPIYYIMYGGGNLDLGSNIFLVSSLTTLTDTIAPIISSMCITLRERKATIIVLVISTIVKFISFYPAILLFGNNGMTISTAISSIVAIVLNLYVLYRRYGVKYKRVLRRLLYMAIAALVSCLPILLQIVGFNFIYTSRILCILVLAIFGSLSLIIYIAASFYMGIPQALWRKDFKDFIKDIKGYIR